MKFAAYLRSIGSRFLRRSRVEDEMAEELRSHIQLRADDLERSGLDRAEAERRASIEFGAQERFKEESCQALGGNFLEVLNQDLRYGLRVLRKSPGFTVAAVLTLALAIGANAVVFGVLNALVLRPLHLPQEESLFAIDRSGIGFESYPNYLDLRERNRSFEDLAIYTMDEAGLDAGKDPGRVWFFDTSGNYFDVVGIQPYLGRFFHLSDQRGPNSSPAIVLGYDFWHTHFQDDRSVVGRTVLVNKRPLTVVGVAPPGFDGTTIFFSPAFYMSVLDQEHARDDRGQRPFFSVIGHLKPGVTPDQAVADLKSVGAYLEKTYPKDDSKMEFKLVRPAFGTDFIGRPTRAFVAGLMLLAMLILLAACANLGSLFGARAADRSREIALRLALGSSRNRILRQLLTEAILLSLAGGAVGLFSSVVLLRRLSTWNIFPRFPMRVPVTPDSNVYVVALLLALVSGLLFGIVPLRQVFRTDPYEIVKSGSTGAVGRRITVRELLLGVQIAICGVLVTSSMVAVRGLVRSLHSNFGIEPQNAMLVGPNMAGYNGDAVNAVRRRMIDAVAIIPGVQSVAVTNLPPLTYDAKGDYVFTDQAMDFKPANAVTQALGYRVSPGYFKAAGTILLSGRAFTWHDDAHAPLVAVINQEMARKVFGSPGAALGGYYKLRDGSRLQVVGIVEDGKYFQLAEGPRAAMFIPMLQSPSDAETWLVVRSNLMSSSEGSQLLATAIRGKLREVDEGLMPYIQPWTREMAAVMFPPRMAVFSLGVLGIMGAMLSITGIFGMAAYSVSKRMRELGIRIALGAQRRSVLQAALGRAFKLLAVGSAAGLVLGILASSVLAHIVFQATPRDPLVLTGVVMAMALLGLVATWIPAQRALSVDPLILLREE
jgi:predicted permease